MNVNVLLIFIFLLGCATSRKNISHGEIVFRGGVYEDKDWSERLKLKRISWFEEATMKYDILSYKLNKENPFSQWLGDDIRLLDECKEFYLILLYSDINAQHNVSYLSNQLQNQGLQELVIPDFKENMKAHHNFRDWRLFQYKIYGYCKKSSEVKELVISIPGYKNQLIQ